MKLLATFRAVEEIRFPARAIRAKTPRGLTSLLTNMRILVVDNYDSFTFNLVHQLSRCAAGEAQITVVRNDEHPIAWVDQRRFDALVISPGPGSPETSRLSLEILRRSTPTPILGVCLGHQAMALTCGAAIERAPYPMHGKVSAIAHERTGLFMEAPQPFEAARYHSLCVRREGLPHELVQDAIAPDGALMAFHHTSLPWWGVQFHPESFLTPYGDTLIHRFLAETRSGPQLP